MTSETSAPEDLGPAGSSDAVSTWSVARKALESAVEQIGGQARDGQLRMVEAVCESLDNASALLVQAGTGTGKSLGYLVPALVRTQLASSKIIVATATLALQNQLATKDGPAVARAVGKVTGREPSVAVLKGRANYACLLKVQAGGDDGQDSLLSGAELVETAHASSTDQTSALGAEVLALREWVSEQARSHQLADRDDAPAHTARAWAQVSVTARQCAGSRCPLYNECFVELARTRARGADLVITNHALLAIDAMSERDVLPDHEAVIIDEAHELTARVTGAASEELSPAQIERVSRAAADWVTDDQALELLDVADVLKGVLGEAEPGRITNPDGSIVTALARIRDVARQTVSALSPGSSKGVDTARVAAQGDARELFDTAQRMAQLSDADVVWVSANERFGPQLNVAPLSVAGLLRHRVLAQGATVLTSATLAIGGSFGAMAGQVGLRRDDELSATDVLDSSELSAADRPEVTADAVVRWRGLDVGTPFDYQHQGILYLANRLPRPGREGMADEVLAQIAQLVWAAEGRTLGLFSSQRNAEAAARHVRAELPAFPVLCQGEAQLSELTKHFAAEEKLSLFGTLSLWQGIDLPGDTCQLVIMDRIPFPRPDDPVMQARQEAVAHAGGNGFMQIAATHAGLLLAQGAGRLIRTASDRGVVAILDPRLVQARYGSYLRASLPPFWTTHSVDIAVEALRRLHGKQ